MRLTLEGPEPFRTDSQNRPSPPSIFGGEGRADSYIKAPPQAGGRQLQRRYRWPIRQSITQLRQIDGSGGFLLFRLNKAYLDLECDRAEHLRRDVLETSLAFEQAA